MTVSPFIAYTQPVLPSVLSDSYSYYEVLTSLIGKIEELVGQVNNLEFVSNTYTDEKVKEAKGELNSSITTINEELKEAIKLLENKEIKDIETLDYKFNVLTNSISANIKTAIDQYNTYLMEYLSKQLIGIKVINFFTGEKVSVQEMFDTLALLHVTDGLTYSEIASRGYTYQEINTICINGSYTYKELILNANTILPVK